MEGSLIFSSSIQSMFSIVESGLGGVLSPLLVKVALSIAIYPNVRIRMSD